MTAKRKTSTKKQSAMDAGQTDVAGASRSGRASVTGLLVDGDGAPIAGTRVALVSMRIRSEATLGEAKTDERGHYSVAYEWTSGLNLLMRAYGSRGRVIAQSQTVFAAAERVVIDFTTAPNGVVVKPSMLTNLKQSVSTQLQGIALTSLKQNKDAQELGFLADAVQVPFDDTVYLFMAAALAAQYKLSDETLFGIFYQGIPANLEISLTQLPESGIDAAFMEQTFTGVLAHSRDTLDRALAQALKANVLPASYGTSQAAQLDQIDVLRQQQVAASPYLGGESTLSALLGAGNVPAKVATAFVQAYAANGSSLSATWSVLRADKSLSAADLTTLDTTLTLGELLSGYLPLIQDALLRLSQKTLGSIRDLALLDASGWAARISAVDPQGTGLPQRSPIATFAQALAVRFAGRYPTTAFVGGLTKAKQTSFASTRQELISFFSTHPTFDLGSTSLDGFLVTNKASLSAAALADLKTAQRLYRISPQYTSVDALKAAGYLSAQSIYFQGRGPFLAQMSTALGGASAAQTAYAQAAMTYATAVTVYGRFNLALNGVAPAASGSAVPDPQTLNNLPDLQALFGSLDYFQCGDCESVVSPAAYLVDLLQYLSTIAASGGGVTNARDALLSRRPDIQYIALDCSNTTVTMPYIDIANEIFESVIAPPATAVTFIDTVGTSNERRALPQQISQAAYNLTAAAVFPLNLPFDLPFAQASAYAAALGTPRAALLVLFAGHPPAAAAAASIAAAALGLNPAMQAVIVGTDPHPPWDRWGFAQHPASVIDPNTRQAYSPNPADWTAAMGKVPVFMNRAGLSLQQLFQLLEALWVTQSTVTLSAGSTIIGTVSVVSADTDLMTCTGLTGDVLDRANRFLRLWTASALNMWELDWALVAHGGTLDNPFLVFLQGALAVSSALKLPFQEVLTFWLPLETRDVTNHLGDEDTIAASTYSEVFRNAAVLASASSIFVPVNTAVINGASNASPIVISTTAPHGFQSGMQVSVTGVAGNTAANGTFTITVIGAMTFSLNGSTGNGAWTSGGQATGLLSGNPIFAVAPNPPTAEQNAVTASLGLTADDVAAILAFSGAANTLSLPTLGTLLKYQRLSSSQSLGIPELILWIQLAAINPFNGTPADTLQFSRRLALLKSKGLGAYDIDYLLRGQSASRTALAFTTPQATAVLQAIRDALAKLPPSYGAEAIQTIFVAALAAATGTTANVVSPILAKTGILPLGAATIAQLIAANSGVDPSQFPALIQAFTTVAKASALFTALNPTETEFAFVAQYAATFNWLDPGALPLAPATASPYALFEALLFALQLDKRQSSRTPKLFDILSLWLPPGTAPTDLPTAIGGASVAVTAASNSTPIALTTAAPHGLVTGMQVTISGVLGNTAANGTFSVTVTSATAFTLDGSVGTGAYTSGGTVSLPSLAQALNGSANDVLAIATALGATPPSLTPATQAGTLADVTMLTAIAKALDATSKYSISGATLVQLAGMPAVAATATTAMGVLQAQYAQSAWLAAITPVQDTLRQQRRDALVAYLLGPGPAISVPTLLSVDDIFDYFLIDPEMCPCQPMTRLLQGSLAIQQFVQQCFLNLFFSGVAVDMSSPSWSEWSWRQQYALWQANRAVFLYPENYVLPELLPNPSSFFTDLQSDLRQSNADADAAQAAIENYLRKLLGVARLQVAAHYNENRADGINLLHVFARTRATPPQWYYRQRTGPTAGLGSWGPWQSLNLDISGPQLLPVIWDQRLHLFWATFKQFSEKQSEQAVPGAGGGSQPSPQQFWSIELSWSELSAGQWQPKRTVPERFYFDKSTMLTSTIMIDRHPLAFTFQAAQDANFNLNISLYYTMTPDELVLAGIFGGDWRANPQIGEATLSMPESPMHVTEARLIPDPSLIDLSQEPSYPLVARASMAGSLITPTLYNYWGEDLVAGSWSGQTFMPQTGSTQLYVLARTNSLQLQPVSVELLGQITQPRIVIPQQETVFDSVDPFFVADLTRTYLVQQEYVDVRSIPKQFNSFIYINHWTGRFNFQTFYHPYARTFLRQLETGGVDSLMSRTLQVTPEAVRGWSPTFDFNAVYEPQPPVLTPYPGPTNPNDPGESALDFTAGSAGAYSLYNWELFYHVPMFVASLLTQNQQFSDALTWYEYIFNPTDSSGGPSPQRYWQMAPLNALSADTWLAQQIQNILTTLAADTAQGINDPATIAAIQNWMNDPFDPHAVAGLRISAYGKATVMKFLDLLIAWGDNYYAQFTAENVNQAEQLYIVADLILGPKPQMLRLPAGAESGVGSSTYASVKNLDAFSNALVNVENLIVAPEPPQALIQGTANQPALPYLPGNAGALLFCISPNEKLLAYWDTVAQRLYNIRHCLNLQGQPQPLPLYGPALNPFNLVGAEGSNAGSSGIAPPAPIYRFAINLQKALELTTDVRSYGALILSALEKQDAETLSVLRANQEADIQTRMIAVKSQQVTEAQDQIGALQDQKAVVQIRYNFYSTVAFMNPWEISAISLQGAALIANAAAVVLDMTSGAAHLLPSVEFGVEGFGGTPRATVKYGGENVGHSTTSWATVARDLGGLLAEAGGMSSTMGMYQRRMDEWNLQAQLAAAELVQMDQQITAATDRLTIANTELSIQQQQASNAKAVANFLTAKYTNAQLYDWMVTQLTTVYTQAYQLAFSLALQAQNAYQYELGSQDTFIQFGYWDSQHKGLTAGESLLFDLRRMEAQYTAANSRELELTKHISLALAAPQALLLLRETGTCQITLDESLFEFDHPGQYFRRLRSVALTVPSVTGPYTGVNATLTLTRALVRTQPPGTTYQPQSATAAPNDPSVIVSPTSASGTSTIATSSGQNDAGLFEVNLHDERWLPFEGQGAISTWNLVLDPRDNNFDFTTITDGILHVRYTARGGADQTAANNVRNAIKPQGPRSVYMSVRSTFSSAYYAFFNPAAPNATSQTLALPLTDLIFPYSNLGSGVQISNFALNVALAVPAAGNTIPATYVIGTSAATAIALSPAPGQTSAGNPIAALTAAIATTAATPATLTLTVPGNTLPAQLATTINGQPRLDPDKIQDILLLIEYSVQ